MIRLAGCLRDKPSSKDWKIEEVQGAVPLPDFVDLSGYDSPIENQQNTGSCVANAVVAAYEHLWRRLNGARQYRDLSRLFAYYNARLRSGNPTTDTGTTIRSCLDACRVQGICLESTMPYDSAKWYERPSDAAYAEAKAHRITAFYLCTEFDHLRKSLAEGFPVVLSFEVFPSFNQLSLMAGCRCLVPARNQAVVTPWR